VQRFCKPKVGSSILSTGTNALMLEQGERSMADDMARRIAAASAKLIAFKSGDAAGLANACSADALLEGARRRFPWR
jgi:hypothetical protein